jgi:hypothetical protein
MSKSFWVFYSEMTKKLKMKLSCARHEGVLVGIQIFETPKLGLFITFRCLGGGGRRQFLLSSQVTKKAEYFMNTWYYENDIIEIKIITCRCNKLNKKKMLPTTTTTILISFVGQLLY